MGLYSFLRIRIGEEDSVKPGYFSKVRGVSGIISKNARI